MDRALLSPLMSLSQEVGVTYVTASPMPVDVLTDHDHSASGSPFFSNFHVIHLGFLHPNEAKSMIQDLTKRMGRGGSFSSADLDFAFSIAGCHPYFLQLACYYLYERKLEHGERGELSVEDYDGIRQQYADDAEGLFHYIWQRLEKEEIESLELICRGRIGQLKDGQKRRLEKKCILWNDDFFSSTFAEFVRKQTGIEPSSPVPAPVLLPAEAVKEFSAPKTCQLNIACSRNRSVSAQVTGSISYEEESGRFLEPDLVDRLDHRTIDALHLEGWRFQIKEIGRELFDELILNRPEVGKGYQRAAGHVEQAALSIALHAPRELLRLPFEALHSKEEGYLCLKYPMYRVVSGCFFDKEPLSTALLDQLRVKGEPLRAFVVASNTWRKSEQEDSIPGVEKEAKQVSALLRGHGFYVHTLSTSEATWERVRDELAKGGYLLFHYAGHGTCRPHSPNRGALYLWEGMKGESVVKELTALQLESLVQNTPLRFVYLSCCWGAHTTHSASLLDDDFLGVMDGLVMGGVPAILGFRWPVSDKGAQSLAKSFYSAWLDEGRRLDEALLKARQTVANESQWEDKAWFSPVLAMRSPAL
jgi:hypothetical protein